LNIFEETKGGKSEILNRIRTENTMIKRKGTEKQNKQ